MRVPARIILAALLLTPTMAAVCSAEEDTPTDSARELMAPAPPERLPKSWEAATDGMWLPKSGSSDAGGEIGMWEAKAKFGRTFPVNPKLSFTPEIAYSILHVSAPSAARVPERLHTVTAGLRTDFRASPRLSFNFLFAPGLASDFRVIGSDDIRVRFGSTVRYLVSPKLTVLGGFVYQQGYKSTRGIPIIGAIYRPTENWTITVAAPRPGVSYAPNKDLRVTAGAEMSGGEYQLHEERIGAEVMRYRDFRFGGGAEFTIVSALKGEVAAGYAVSRRFSFYDTFDATRRNIAVDSAPFVRAGLKMQW